MHVQCFTLKKPQLNYLFYKSIFGFLSNDGLLYLHQNLFGPHSFTPHVNEFVMD